MHRYRNFAIHVQTHSLAGAYMPRVKIVRECGQRSEYIFCSSLCAHESEELAHHHGIHWARSFIDANFVEDVENKVAARQPPA